MKRFLTLLAILIVSSFNLFSQGFTSQKGGNCYTLDLPNYMVKTYELNQTATLQYQNSKKEAYLIVIDDDKERLHSIGMKFVSSADYLSDDLGKDHKGATEIKVGKIVEFVENGLNHAQAEVEWKDEDGDFFELVTVVESKDRFYEITCWTILENKDKLLEDFKKISKSLKE